MVDLLMSYSNPGALLFDLLRASEQLTVTGLTCPARLVVSARGARLVCGGCVTASMTRVSDG